VLTWDEAKRARNLAKHGVDFAILRAEHFAAAWVRGDTRYDYGEVRLIALLPINGRLHAAVYTIETRAVRLINLRKASQKEFDTYAGETHVDPANG
jgi:uncharacterized DUF497 family protein